MKIAIRVDASNQIGTGHLFRCLTLADALKKVGCEIHFLCRQLDGFSPHLIISASHTLHIISEKKEKGDLNHSQGHLAHASWLPCTQAQDFAGCGDILKKISPLDWIITDHYALDYRWEEKATHFTDKILVIDDLADRDHICTLLLDQNYYPNMQDRYLGLVPFGCKTLTGPQFALLRPQFLRQREKLREVPSTVRNFFIFFGGVDPSNETLKALRAIHMLKRNDLQVDVVIGSANPNKETIHKFSSSMGYVRCHEKVSDMARIMSCSDLAVGAAGTNSWERCCLGLPSVIEIIADNQIAIADGLEELGVGWNLGYSQDVDVETLFLHLRNLIASPDIIQQYSQQALDVVDGKGTDRVIRAIQTYEPTIKTSIHTATDKLSEANSGEISPKKNPLETYSNFFNPDGHTIGKISFSTSTEKTQISLSLDNTLNGLNYESVILEKGLQLFHKNFKLHPNYFLKEIFFSSFKKSKTQLSVKDSKQSVFIPSNSNEKTSNLPLTTAIVSSHKSWINKYLLRLIAETLLQGFSIRWIHNVHDLENEDIVFYLSCEQLTPKNILVRHKHNLVVHESALPEGRGWSPLTWQVLEGRSNIPITLFEAQEKVDSGRIYLQKFISLRGDELIEELREKQAIYTIDLCLNFLRHYPDITQNAKDQVGRATYYPKRTPKDSELNIDKSIIEQFNLLRVVDNNRYPAWFVKDGREYIIKIEKK